MDFHGQPHARLSSDQTVYRGLGPRHGRSLIFTLLSPLLFLAPDNYLQDMEILWIDGYVILTDWESFMNDLLQEWKDILLPVMQLGLIFIASGSRDFPPVDRDAFSHRELPCHPRHRPFQFQCDKSETSHYFYISRPDCEHPLDSNQCREHCD